MNSLNFCEECEIEFKIKHDANDEFFKVRHCPFCGIGLNVEEQYDLEQDEDEE